MKLNKKYKDRLFCLLFGNEEYKENILSLYNALCNTAHTDVNDIKLYTIDNVIYIEMKNDVSILLDSYLHLWEQQSSYNPNMPLRGLMYFSKMYDRYIVEHSYNIYGSTLVKLPTPRYTVLYNGTSKQPAFMKLKLSDAFVHDDTSGDFEWTANMVNINHGMNDELLNNCRPLQEYMLLIEEIRKNRSDGMEVEQAVDKAVTYCINNNILSEFLTKHRAEVIDVCITEYDEQAFVNGIREEGRQEGRALTLYSLVNSGNLKPDIAAKELGISIHEFEIAMKKA
ncbi:hypothetical protein, partial [Agathobacter rectalis]|uniref:hypothetical protein n=1 Tax=Agathobacter rectalis TaxID=39491 RepID=UPI0027D26E0E